MLSVIDRHRALLGETEQWRRIDGVYRRWAGTHLWLGRPKEALRPALRRLRHHPLSAEGWWVLAKAGVLALAPARVAQALRQPMDLG
jgi:hypothetical protein